MIENYKICRRDVLKSLSAVAVLSCITKSTAIATAEDKITRNIPGTKELLPVIGVGSSITFDVSPARLEFTELPQVMQAFFEHGGELVDSSPMYGNAESVIGNLVESNKDIDDYFAATKVWTRGKEKGIDQMQASFRNMNVKVMDLMQIHNLLDWKVHLDTLNNWKKKGLIRYTGITTYGGRNHGELINILKTRDVDFVQFTYNVLDRKAEKELFPLVRDKGIGTIINIPFRRGSLFNKVKGKHLPGWANEFDCKSWGQFFLKFIASHPDVTCIIPATTKLNHMVDNMAAGFGRLPDPDTRKRMITHMENL
jgi:diketogulonate reductase-like aldo/keto reductase